MQLPTAHLPAPAMPHLRGGADFAVLVLVLMLLGCVVSPARAGQYVVSYCGGGAAAERWSAYATQPGTAANECGGQGRMRASMVGTVHWGKGSTAVLAFTAPDGTTVAGWTPNIRYGTVKHDAETERLRLTVGTAQAASPPITCINTLCPAVINSPIPLLPGTRTIEARTTCSNELPQYSGCRFEAEMLDYGGTVTLQDDHAPTARGEISGPLAQATSPPAGIRGSATVGALIDDVGSGVWKTELRRGSTVVAEALNGCTPQPTSSVVPCPLAQQASIEFDSTKLVDGAHELSVVTIDASGNETVVWRGRVFTVNAPIGPGSSPELRGSPTGSDATDNARITASWPITAHRPPKACNRKKYRARHRARCTRRPGQPIFKGAFATGRPITLTGRLTNTGTADPIVGAPVQIVGTVLRGNSDPWVTTATTGPTGRWTVTVPRDIGARRLVVNYRSRQYDTVDSARTEAHLLVRAQTQIRVVPRRTRPGRRVRFGGRLADGHAGVPVVLQAYSRGRYRTFATVSTGAGGRFSVRYRMGRGFRGVYRFRAQVRPTSITPYPYLGGRSNRVSVRVSR